MRRHGFLAIMLAGATACSAWLLNQHHPLDASEETNRSFREAFKSTSDQPEPVEDSDGIRLSYFDASWERVLRDVAKQANLTLVMEKIPHGSFARRDRTRYQVDSAVNILNTELEPQGFRLLQQHNFLIVLKLDQARTRYSRPVLNEWKNVNEPNRANGANGAQAANNQRSQFVTASARKDDDSPRVSWASQQTEAATPFADKVVPQPRPASGTPPTKAEEGPAVQKSVSIRNAKASEVARSIYLVFESRAELISKGLQGLPTFVVQRTAADAAENEAVDTATPLFQIGIDQVTNTLLLEASKTRVDHLSRLIAEMDKPADEKAETVKLVPNKGVTDLTAKDLSEQIRRMVAMRSKADESTPANAPLADDSDDSSLNLRGDVNVQAMQDLGILILKGNEADVRKVEAIIKQLEEMSVGSLPDIHLLTLEHVNSEAMAELMTSVYEQLTELRNRGTSDRKTAAFIPVVQPNSLLIISPAIELESILALADELDRRTDPESEFKVFSLRNAIASQVATSVESFYEERGGLGTKVRVLADARTNAIIVQGRANDIEEIAKLVEKFDVDSPGAVHRVEIIALKHATAEALAEIINTAIQSVSSPPQQVQGGNGGFGGNQGAQELRDGKSAALEFLTTTGGGKELIKSGILVDVRVNADPRSNSLIISAPEASIPLLKALATQLDLPPSAVASIKVFALQNADAELSVELLTSLFEDQNQEDQLGVQIDGTQGASSSLIPVQFSADIRTNTVLAIGGEESLSVVEAILLRLDSAESGKRRTQVIPMRNVLASVVADALETFLEQQQDLQDSSGLISNIERLRQEVIIAPDDNSNSLIVSASPEYFGEISQIISELDANPPQVIIQALIVEVILDNTDEFGVELGFQDPLLFSRGLIDTVETITQTGLDPDTGFTTNNQTVISANGNPGFNFNNTVAAIGNNVSGLLGGQNGIGTAPRTVASQGISNFSLGRQNGDLGFGGFVFSAQSDAVSVLVRALAARRTVHVLSRPQIRTTHNNTASIQVGQQVPVVNGVSVTDNFVTPQIEQQDVGIILRVTPRVTPDGNISMEVYAEKSSLSGGGVPVFTDATTGNVVESVIIDSAIADTTVSVPNGQTIVIGGMITKSDETLERKVPWLGDLPLIGRAFRYDGTNTRRSELLIFLTPRIIYGDADSELIKQVESERLHFIESEAEEIHGPLYSVPASEVDHYRMPQSEFMAPGEPVQMDMEHYQPSDNAIVLPPQARAGGRGVNPTATGSKSAGAVVTTGGSDLDPKVMQALAKAAKNNNQATALAEEDKAAAAEWVRTVLEEKRMKAAEGSSTPIQQTSATKASKAKANANAKEKNSKVIQAGNKQPDREPLRTLSAAEAAIDNKSLQSDEPKAERAWTDRFRWSKK